MRFEIRSGLVRVFAGLGVVAWAGAVVAGFGAIEAYEATPGPTAPASSGWPGGSALAFVPGRPNVVMALHPRCPCSRASLDALAEIVGRTPGPVSVRLLIYRPVGSSPAWASSRSRLIDGADRVDDPGGAEAGRFGLATSGAVAAFDAGGRPRFSGGLTAGRGRSGPSDGGKALLAVLRSEEPGRRGSAVYGCGLGLEPGPAGPPGGGR